MSITLPGLEPKEVAALIPHRPILVGYRGSRAHGMYVPPSDPTGIDDIDIQAVYIPDLETYFGPHLDPPRGKDIKVKEWDSAAYEVRHMVGLLCNGNPNVLSLLWNPGQIHVEREGQMLIDARRLFATKRAYHSFGGYAHAQLKRMTSFREVGASACGCGGKFHEPTCAANQEAGRGSSKRFATGFMGEKRKALVAKFGYDAKNAAHLLRLLKMGCEFLRTGEIVVDRRVAGDADWLLSVKRGEWALWDVQAEAEKLFEEMRAARDASTLPEQPDARLVRDLLMDILVLAHGHAVTLRAAQVTRRLCLGEPQPEPPAAREWPRRDLSAPDPPPLCICPDPCEVHPEEGEPRVVGRPEKMNPRDARIGPPHFDAGAALRRITRMHPFEEYDHYVGKHPDDPCGTCGLHRSAHAEPGSERR